MPSLITADAHQPERPCTHTNTQQDLISAISLPSLCILTWQMDTCRLNTDVLSWSRWVRVSGARKGLGQLWMGVQRKPFGERTSFTLPGPPLSEQAVWRRHNPKYSINTTLISSKSVCVLEGGFRGI